MITDKLWNVSFTNPSISDGIEYPYSIYIHRRIAKLNIIDLHWSCRQILLIWIWVQGAFTYYVIIFYKPPTKCWCWRCELLVVTLESSYIKVPDDPYLQWTRYSWSHRWLCNMRVSLKSFHHVGAGLITYREIWQIWNIYILVNN